MPARIALAEKLAQFPASVLVGPQLVKDRSDQRAHDSPS